MKLKIMLLALGLTMLASCQEKSTTEKAVDSVEEGMEEVQDEIDDHTTSH